MANTENVISVLPLVANALGRKYGVKVHIGGERAYTDGKNIHLPSLPLNAGEDVLKLVRGYLDHEAAHLRITDFNALNNANIDALEKQVWNVLEDYLVEKRLSALYPGCRQNLAWLIDYLFVAKQADDIQHPAEAIFHWLLRAVRTLAMPELAANRDKCAVILDTHYLTLRGKLEPLVMSVDADCVDTRSCLAKAHEIMGVIKDYAKAEADNQQKKGESGESQQEGGGNEAQGARSGNGGNNGEPPQSKGSGDQDAQSASPAQNRTSEKQNQQEESNDTGITQSTANDADADKTAEDGGKEKTLQEYLANPDSLLSLDLGQQAGNLLQGYAHSDIHELMVAIAKKSTAKSLLPVEISEIRQGTAALRIRLQALLQATVVMRNRIGRSGKIDVRRVARLAVNDPKVFVRHGERTGTSVAIQILLDCSYSMRGTKIRLAVQACYGLALALANIRGVSLAIAAFPAGLHLSKDADKAGWQTVMTLKCWGEKLHTRFNAPCQGGTPLAEALWWALQEMQFVSANRKMMLIVSDGEPDDMSAARNAIQTVSANGIEVYGIGVETAAMRFLMSESHSRSIYDLKELAPAMFDVLQGRMLAISKGAA